MVKKYKKIQKCENCYSLLKIKNRKNYFDVNKFNKSRHKKFIFEKLSQISKFASTIGLVLSPVKFTKKAKIQNNKEFTKNDLKILEEERTEENETFLHSKAKDISMLSRRKYQSFRKICGPTLSSNYHVGKIYNKIHTAFPVMRNRHGFFLNPEEKIKFVLKKTLEKMQEDKLIIENNTFIIKFCADGTNITKSRLQIINFAFTIINDKTTAMSVRGNYILGYFFEKSIWLN